LWRWCWLLTWLADLLLAQAPDSIREKLTPLPEVLIQEQLTLRTKRWEADKTGWPLTGGQVAQLLAQVEGLYLRDYGGHGSLKTVSLRGMGAPLTAVRFQGLPLRQPQLGLVDLSPFYLAGLKEVRFSPTAHLEASSGAIGLIEFWLRPEASSARTGWWVGSFGEVGAHTVWERPRWLVQGAALSAENRYPFQEPVAGLREHAQYRQVQGALVWSGRPWTLTTWGYHSGQAIPGPVVIGASTSPPEELYQSHLIQSLTYEKGPWQGDLQGQLQYLKHLDRFREPAFSRLLSWQGQVRRSFQVKKSHIEAGLYAAYDRVESNRLAVGFRPLSSLDQGEAALWGSFMRSWGPWVVRTEGRLSWLSRYPLLPSVKALLRWGPWGLEAMRGIRFPSLWERYWVGYGNPTLQPEKTFQIQVFLEKIFRSFTVYGAAFWAQTKDRILTVPLSPVRWQAYSLGYVESHGLEGRLTWQPGSFQLWVAGTYLVARDYSLTAGQLLPYTPPYLGLGGLAYTWGPFSFSYGVQHVSWRLNSLAGLETLPPYGLHTLSLRYTRKAYRIELRAENLTNVSYQVIQGYPMPGRRIVVGIETLWSGRLP